MYHTQMAFLRSLLEFRLSGNLRGHARDSSKSIENIFVVSAFVPNCFGRLCEPLKWQKMGYFFSIK